MNNEELIRILDRDQLLLVAELLCSCLAYPDYDLYGIGSRSYAFPYEVFDYCVELTNYERLKLVQIVINTLVIEAEEPTMPHFQTLLPLGIEA